MPVSRTRSWMNISSSYCLRVSIVPCPPCQVHGPNQARTNPKHGELFYFSSSNPSTRKMWENGGFRLCLSRIAPALQIKVPNTMRSTFSPGLGDASMGRADDQRVGGREHAQHGGILNGEWFDPALAVPQINPRADVILPPIIRWQVAAPTVRADTAFRARVPSIAAIAGRRNSIAQTSVETGLPGRPSSGMSRSRPKISGLPGRIAIFQKSSANPPGPSALWTRSWSPTDAPPSVTSRSAPFGFVRQISQWLRCCPAGCRDRPARRPIARSAPIIRTRMMRRCRPVCAVRRDAKARRPSPRKRREDAAAPRHGRRRPPQSAKDREASACLPAAASTSPALKSSPAARMWRPFEWPL